MHVDTRVERIRTRLAERPQSSYELDGRGALWRTLMDGLANGYVRVVGVRNAQLVFELTPGGAWS